MTMNNQQEEPLIIDDEDADDGSSYASDNGDDDDDAASNASSSQQSFATTKGSHFQEKELRAKIIQHEDRHVNYARNCVMIVVSICAAAVSISIFFFALRSEEHFFQSEYEDLTQDVFKLASWETIYNFALVQELSATMTSTSILMNQTFPFVTLPHFQVDAGYVNEMGRILGVCFVPFVQTNQFEAWRQYQQDNRAWIVQSQEYEKTESIHASRLTDLEPAKVKSFTSVDYYDLPVIPNRFIYSSYDPETGKAVPETANAWDQEFAPVWQSSPASAEAINYNLLSNATIVKLYKSMMASKRSVMSVAMPDESFHFFQPSQQQQEALPQEPQVYILDPVHSTFEMSPEPVGFMLAVTYMSRLLDRHTTNEYDGLVCVLSNECNGTTPSTFQYQNGKAVYLGAGDLHNPDWDAWRRTAPIQFYFDADKQPVNVQHDICLHYIDIYPSNEFKAPYVTSKPQMYCFLVVLAFLLTAGLLAVYDTTVNKRQEKTMKSALRSTAIVSSLFPEQVRDRLLDDAEAEEREAAGGRAARLRHEKNSAFVNKNHPSLSSADGGAGEGSSPTAESKAIADFFPEATIMFADIVGFTAWSSTREPFQVFQLLESIYGEFDALAKRRRVFKVETVGDCYVAVCGLPTPRKDHAVVMARFARDCHTKMRELSHKLEVELGPDTADLCFRIGLHSGAVMGGVLRGDNARFQLFGDTMNTAARMESTGQPDRSHISATTAELLKVAGKKHWITARDQKVVAKGKGELETYWLHLDQDGSSRGETLSTGGSISTMDPGDMELDYADMDPRQHSIDKAITATTTNSETHALSAKDWRLIDWNVSVLLRRLSALMEQRDNKPIQHEEADNIDNEVKEQLQKYIVGIASAYRANGFHNFAHASHVTMGVTKMLSRVVVDDNKNGNDATAAPTNSAADDNEGFRKDITADGLMQFAIVFSALIHDVDHSGLPNAVLVSQRAPVAIKYHDKSVAENNSIDVAWQLLMRSEFWQLRQCICPNAAERERFHQLVIQIVLATDIVDKDLKIDRNARWIQVFSESSKDMENINSIKARIVLEHLIQASDVSHTMQHWHIYRKWNECFFIESYQAYQNGHAEKDPADGWYMGELGFFDFYIIPLAKKLKDCGVFGVSSDEFYNYATANRQEWELKGKQVVAEYVEKHCRNKNNTNNNNNNKSPAVNNTSTTTTTTAATTKTTLQKQQKPPLSSRLEMPVTVQETIDAATTTTTSTTVENEGSNSHNKYISV